MRTDRPQRCKPSCRKGSIVVLVAITLPVLFILAALAINASYMQMTRTELFIATDAATRAAGRTFSELQDVDDAKTAAKATAAKNMVAGESLQLRTGDDDNEIEFGMTSNDGTYSRFQFTKVATASVSDGSSKANAVRVLGRRDSGSLGGTIQTLFPKFLTTDTFSPTQTSVAMQVDRDISLVLDRSGSMDYLTITWPSGKSPYYTSTIIAGVAAGYIYSNRGSYYYSSGVTSEMYEQWAWEEYYELGPYPQTPWKSLVAAVDGFLDVLDETHPEEHVSIASYASNATLDLYLEDDYDEVRDELDTLYPSGSTAIGMGMQKGIEALLHASARPYAAKTMVVMTDGMHNYGIDPVTVATSLVATYNLTIHTVTFGSGADKTRMQNVATIGGGSHYHADDGTALKDVFEEIANNLPVLLTE
ncbi:von Willebrand factor type A domain protein [Rosistilla carotiformis]|uniref:von Willebrand factor type A domain protein n=1 Tax=Rosistilla carotiformis TaxID=2528017 RepID=A0A518JUE3_9BACT|nr:VWA domain-containing protein [Rosistilla carotiformis]QDV69168.1 von Willebrand factor type A domain protein [Rosistilla carotiformis]